MRSFSLVVSLHAGSELMNGDERCLCGCLVFAWLTIDLFCVREFLIFHSFLMSKKDNFDSFQKASASL